MSGHIVKITLENTHPPVWRRVILPEHISFHSLHQVIQEIFGWEEEHLHGFTFPQPGLSIGDSKMDSWNDTLEEREADVDDLLLTRKWIRYTYDFGDDWRHKIVYEKDDPDYKARYAVVKKFKGDNFMEDSGGIWSDQEENRFPFDLEETNERLLNLELSVVESSEEVRDAILGYAHQEQMERLLKEIARPSKKRKRTIHLRDQMREMLDQWKAFYEKWEEFQERESFLAEEHYEQMALPGIEVPEGPEGCRRTTYVIEKRTAASASDKFLEKLNGTQREDYCNYLGISLENIEKEEQPATIAACLGSHPEYYLYVLEREDLSYVKRILAQPDGPVSAPPFAAVHRAVNLGLMSVSVEKSKEQERAVFTMAAGLSDIFEKLPEPLCEKTYQMLERVRRNVNSYLLVYGLIELDSLYERYIEDFRETMEKEDFRRILYWHCRFNDIFSIGYLQDDQVCVVSHQLDPRRILQGRMQYAKDLKYYPFSTQELKMVQEGGCGALYSCWDTFTDFCLNILEREEEAFEMLNHCYISVADGNSADEVFCLINQWYEPATIAEWVQLWQMVMEVCLDTGLPMLKGYTRTAYARNTHQNPYELDLFDREYLEESLAEETPLFFAPARIQQEVMEIVRITDVSLRLKQLERLTRKFPVQNCDILFLLATFSMEAGKLSKAEKYMQSLNAAWPEDEGVQILYQELSEQFQRTTGFLDDSEEDLLDWAERVDTTYRREERKVGRNEPLPLREWKKI